MSIRTYSQKQTKMYDIPLSPPRQNNPPICMRHISISKVRDGDRQYQKSSGSHCLLPPNNNRVNCATNHSKSWPSIISTAPCMMSLPPIIDPDMNTTITGMDAETPHIEYTLTLIWLISTCYSIEMREETLEWLDQSSSKSNIRLIKEINTLSPLI